MEIRENFRRKVNDYFNPVYPRYFIETDSEEYEWLKEGTFENLLPKEAVPMEFNPPSFKLHDIKNWNPKRQNPWGR